MTAPQLVAINDLSESVRAYVAQRGHERAVAPMESALAEFDRVWNGPPPDGLPVELVNVDELIQAVQTRMESPDFIPPSAPCHLPPAN